MNGQFHMGLKEPFLCGAMISWALYTRISSDDVASVLFARTHMNHGVVIENEVRESAHVVTTEPDFAASTRFLRHPIGRDLVSL